MTTLAMMATYEKKRLKCYGTVAAGEHVAVTVTDGAPWIGEGKALRLRVLFGPDTVGVFPFADGDAWTATGTQNADAYCELNLNTLQAEKYLKRGGTCLWILDDVENHTLYATGEFDVLPWPKRRGIDEPIDLDGYPLLLDEIKDLKEAFEEYQRTVAQMLATKQDTIFDLATIRSGAAAGATAVQPSQIARFVDGAEYKQSYGEQNKPAILFKHGTNVIVALDATPFVRDGMVSDVVISGGNLVITFNTDAGQEPISIPLTDIFNPANYYDKTATDNLLAPKVARTELFPAWAANTAYTTTSLVIHENAVYKCTEAHTSGASWDSTKWAVATGADVLGVLLDYLALSNKPQINGVPLAGGKTGAQLGLQNALSAQQLANIAAVSDALAFDATHSYAAGDPVVYNDTLYTFTTAHTGAWTGSDVSAVDIVARLAGKADKVAYANDGNLAALDADGNLKDSNNTVQGTFGCGELVVGYSPNQRYVDIRGQGAVSDHCTIIVYNSDLLGHYHYIALPNSYGADKESICALEHEIAPAFDDEATYAEGALVYYNDALYRCTTAVTTAGAWTGSTNWTPATVEDVLAALRGQIAGKADASDLRYSYNTATVSSGTTPTVTGLADRAINTATLGSSVTAATVTLPAATANRARDFFIDLTIEATTAPTLTFIDPATNTTANVTYGADSLADIDTGKNAVLFTEFPNYTWIVSVKHEGVSA